MMKHRQRSFGFRIVLVGAVLISGYLFSLIREQVFAQYPALGQAGSAAQVVVRPQPEPPRWLADFSWQDDPAQPGRKVQIGTIVDPESKHILTYQLDGGKIKLLGVRNIQPDILIDQFNAVAPAPSEIRREIERLRQQTP
ncbi:MAG: hypothetical protein LBN39_07195 [Planctomycetaceae bacterium]|jgi:hypothetical protein|nr:hypothetical protein [Planctomycetaceae bacterium]